MKQYAGDRTVHHAVFHLDRRKAKSVVVLVERYVYHIFHAVSLIDALSCIVVHQNRTSIGTGFRNQCNCSVVADRTGNNIVVH